MLGLGAQHLTLVAKTDYTKQAISHRVQAIKALNAQLSKPNPSKDEGDATFGAVMSLCFQSSYMADGMMEFVSMVRGCVSSLHSRPAGFLSVCKETDRNNLGHVVATKAMPCFEDSAFNSFSREGHVSTMQKFIDASGIERSNYGVVDEFLASTRALAPLCKSVFELKYLADVQRVMGLARSKDPTSKRFSS
jgi:hypothetical protein